MGGWKRLAFVLGVAAVGAPASDARAGTGANCYAQLDGLTFTKGRRVECTDGDPSCDTDGVCNGTCEFLLRLCLDQCTAPQTIQRVRVKGAALEVPELPATGPACGGYVSVKTGRGKGKRKPRPGKAVIAYSAFGGGRFRLTKDKVTLLCHPRTDACPPLPETKDDTIASVPVLSVDPPTPAGGTPAKVTVDFPAASSIMLTASGEGCGGFGTHGPSGSPLMVTQPVGAFGGCDLTADVTTPGGPQTFHTHFEVTPTDLVVPALEVQGSLFLPGDLPPQTGGPDDPMIGSIDAPGSLVNGGSAQLRIQLANPAQAPDVKSVQVHVMGAGGYTGFYEAPAVLEGSTIVVTAILSGDFTPGGSGAVPGPLDLLVQLVDRLGNVGNRVMQSFSVVEVGSGSVQVSLSWNTPTDVDLHVVEPGGEEIYYGHRTSATGGRLDLDSNAGCSIDNVDNENITWSGAAPPGEYVVRVDFWSDCGGLPANYTATTRACGEVGTYTGAFAGGTADRGGSGSGVEVARFTTDCTSRVRGKAVYEDLAQTMTGLAAASTMLPIRFAKVEVKRAADDMKLASGDTKQDGTFDLRFTNTGPKGYYVVVMANQDNEVVKQNVMSDTAKIYSVRSEGVIDESAEPDKTGLMIVARTGGAGPAFNIFDVGVVGTMLVRSVHGVTPPTLNWLWTKGKKGTCTGNVSCYKKATRTISVLSIPADPDEYDDLVLLHEYGHYYQNLYSRSDSPGGPHSSRSQVDPRLAWGEGSATFFGNVAQGTSVYLDTNPSGIGVRLDIESLDAAIPLGTSNGTQNGSLSEAVVAAVLWDLFDSTNEAKDTLIKRDAVFGALAYLGGAKFADRGLAGADLVDLADGWFCLGQGNRGDATSGVQGNAVGIHQFNYDFAPVASCR